MNRLFTKDDQLSELPAKGFLNHNISIIKFEIFHLLVFCPEILLGLIRKTDLNHPGAASWYLPGIFKISAPATTQYDVNVRAQLCGLRASRTGLAPLEGLQPRCPAFLGHFEFRKENLPAVYCSEIQSLENAETHLPALSPQRRAGAGNSRPPKNLQRCPAGAEAGPGGPRSPWAP